MKLRHLITVCLCVAVAAGSALAQGKPNAPRLPSKSGSRAPDLELFKAAYERAGEPRLLVLCGLDSRPRQAGADTQRVEQTVTGGLADDRYVGGNLRAFDQGGDAMKLKTDIEEVFLQHQEVELVDLDTLAEMDRREISLLQSQDELRAVELLRSKLNADIIFVVRMLHTSVVAQAGANYRVTVDTLDASRGRKIDTFSFDWKGALDGVTIKNYGRQIARKLIERFAAHYSARKGATARAYTLRLVGVNDVADLRKARDAFKGIPGVQKVRDGAFSRDASASVATLKLTYAGSLLDLVYEIQTRISDSLGRPATVSDAVAGTVSVVLREEKKEPPRERWQRLIDGDKEVVDGFVSEYTEEGSPRIGIVVNRELTEEEKLDPAVAEELKKLRQGGGGDSVLVTVAPVVNVGSGDVAVVQGQSTSTGSAATPQATFDPALLDRRQVENALYKRFNKLSVTMVDPDVLKQKLLEEARRVFHEEELVWLLSKHAKAAGLDVLIIGTGHVSRTRPPAGGRALPVATVYTFRAVRLSDGVTVAAETWSSDMSWPGAEAFGDKIEQLAAYVTGKLADQMWDSWAPPRQLAVTVHNAGAQRDVISLMTFFEESLPGVTRVDFVEHQATGIGKFNVSYEGSYDDFLKAITSREETLPFALDSSGTTRDALAVRIR